MPDSLETASVAARAIGQLYEEYRKQTAKLEELERHVRGASDRSLPAKKRQLLELREKLLDLQTQIEDAEQQAGRGRSARFEDDRGSRWDDLVEKLNADAERHQANINKFAGGANAAVIAATLAFFNDHIRDLNNHQLALFESILIVAVCGLVLSPLHAVFRLLELRRVRSSAMEGRGEVHWARMIAYLTSVHRRYSLGIGLLLVLQFAAWLAGLVLGWNLLVSVSGTID